MRPAILQGLIVYAEPRGGEATFVRVDQWLPKQKKIDPVDAQLELATRFLTAFGPATHRDFTKWSGLPTSVTKPLFDRLGPRPRGRHGRRRAQLRAPARSRGAVSGQAHIVAGAAAVVRHLPACARREGSSGRAALLQARLPQPGLAVARSSSSTAASSRSGFSRSTRSRSWSTSSPSRRSTRRCGAALDRKPRRSARSSARAASSVGRSVRLQADLTTSG